MHVAQAGAGDPVLLLHGWPQNFYCWRKVIPLLVGEFRLICPDLRGFGWSDAPAGSYLKRTFAEDALALLDALELERVDLIAHDWGAWAGFQMCLDHPKRIGHYLALNMATPWPAPPSLRGLSGLGRLWYQAALATPGLGPALLSSRPFVSTLIARGSVRREAFSKSDLELYQALLREPARARASMHLYRTFLLRELLPYIRGRFGDRRLEVPTLLFHGMGDPAMDYRSLGRWRENAREMAVEPFEGCGHFSPEEVPQIVADRARALFGGVHPAEILTGAR